MGRAVGQVEESKGGDVLERPPGLPLPIFVLLAILITTTPASASSASQATTVGSNHTASLLFPSPASRPTVRPREAYVSLLYGDAYALPLRVMMQSLLENSPDVSRRQRRRIVIVTGSTSPQTIRQLQQDQIDVLPVPTVLTPYANNQKFQQRFLSVMTKLTIFNLTDYDKLLFIDADALVLQDLSNVFSCATTFCAAFINPCYFNAGLMLVSPNASTYEDMLRKLAYLPSYDGGDQGFLNAYYPDLLSAPMFDPTHPPSYQGHNPIGLATSARLPFPFHMDHSAYYPRFRWGHSKSRCGGDVRELEWLGPTFMKPWLWYTYAVLDQSWVWHQYRRRIRDPYPYGSRTDISALALIVSSYVLILLQLYILLDSRFVFPFTLIPPNSPAPQLRNMLATRMFLFLFRVLPRLSPFGVTHSPRRMLHAVIISAILWSMGFAISFVAVPPMVPPMLATLTFIHVRFLVNVILFTGVVGPILCHQPTPKASPGDLYTSSPGPTISNSYLQRGLMLVVIECLLWSLLDSVYICIAFYVLWLIPFKVMYAKLACFIVAMLSHVMVTVFMLVRVTFIWSKWVLMAWNPALRTSSPRRNSR